jgi:selenide,water dikinase
MCKNPVPSSFKWKDFVCNFQNRSGVKKMHTYMNTSIQDIRLTQYSHGAGCGCKISPKMLEEILHSQFTMPDQENLIVGNHSRDDAAVYDLGNGQALIATTDFFMPIVDDPFEFGRIASANAISDIYAMGGKPILAIAILGWPVNILPISAAHKIIEGSRTLCREAGIPLAGGHSIDSPEPIFGLAVNGLAPHQNIKKNNSAREGDWLFLTKPLGTGILTTAEKMGLLKKEHQGIAAKQMMQLNSIGEILGHLPEVTALTDVTGFGLLGHLLEMAEGSGLSAILHFNQIPLIVDDLKNYIPLGSVPGGTQRNWESYGEKISIPAGRDFLMEKSILADPQTSGGLLIAVERNGLEKVKTVLIECGFEKSLRPIGQMVAKKNPSIQIS